MITATIRTVEPDVALEVTQNVFGSYEGLATGARANVIARDRNMQVTVDTETGELLSRPLRGEPTVRAQFDDITELVDELVELEMSTRL